ncbi:MAG: hypothetical protein HY507_00340 [Candidatus Zambryskibacteria bacterium]|nr:hypothetical protein [Candidatus Zambryskibacteria bacterium]
MITSPTQNLEASSSELDTVLNPKPKNFDILHSQLDQEPTPEDKGNKIKIRFEDIPKPTELPPLHIPVFSVEKVEEERQSQEKFIPPEFLITYIDKLISSGRNKLKVLSFDIKESGSNEQIINFLNSFCDSGQISQEEKKEMLAMLTDSKPKAEILTTLVETETSPEIFIRDPETIRSRRISRNKLKEKGIVTPEVGETFTEREKDITQKSIKVWERDNGNIKTIVKFLEDSKPKSSEKSAETAETPKNVRSFDGILRKPEVKLETQVVEEKSPITSISQPASAEGFGEAKEKIIGRHVWQLPFSGKEGRIQIVHGEADGSNNNTIKVFFDNSIIAEGLMTENGLRIEMNRGLKGGLLLDKTDAEKAFENAMLLIKTFKNAA